MKLQEPLIVPYHDSEKHKYQQVSGTCITCGWLHTEDTPRLSCCGRTLREHVEEWQDRMKYLKEYILAASDEELASAESSLNQLMSYIRLIRYELQRGKSIRVLYSDKYPHRSDN